MRIWIVRGRLDPDKSVKRINQTDNSSRYYDDNLLVQNNYDYYSNVNSQLRHLDKEHYCLTVESHAAIMHD